MTKKLNIGILGCSDVAKRYAINAFKALDEVGDIVIASRDLNQAKSVASQFNIKFSESYKDLVESHYIDAVYIPLPIGLHEKWGIEATLRKKHLIIEKSLSDSLVSVKKIIAACKKNQLVLFENFMCDYHPQHQKVLDLINSKEIGDPFIFKGYFGFPHFTQKDSFRYNPKLGGGSLNDAGAYTVFMARKIFETEPESVMCNLHVDKKSKVDIQGSAYLKFSKNREAFIGFGFGLVYQNNYSVWATEGSLTVDRAYAIPPTLKPPVFLYKNKDFKSTNEEVDIQPVNHFELIFKDFCQTIITKNSKTRNLKYKQILNQAIALQAMRISAKKNKPVKLKGIK